MDNRKSRNIFGYFPNDIGFVINRNDPLHILLDGAGEFIWNNENMMEATLNDLFLESANPTLPTDLYYVTASFYDDNSGVVYDFDINDDTEYTGTAEIVTSESDFRSMEITGIGRYIAPGDATPTESPDEVIDVPVDVGDTIGVQYGFDWTDPYWYFTNSGHILYTYDADLTQVDALNLSIRTQSYAENSRDEYLELQWQNIEFFEDWTMTDPKSLTLHGYIIQNAVKLSTIYDGVEYPLELGVDYTITTNIDATADVDIPATAINKDAQLRVVYKHQYGIVENLPVSDFVLLDILNMDINGNAIALERSGDAVFGDYILEGRFVYMKNDVEWKSRYIVEYNYEQEVPGYYLMADQKRGDLGLKGSPFTSLPSV